MIKQKKLVLLFALCLSFTASQGQVKQDSVAIQNQQYPEQPKINLKTETKRQRNKNGIIVFASCLFIISTTILLYNVRSK